MMMRKGIDLIDIYH